MREENEDMYCLGNPRVGELAVEGVVSALDAARSQRGKGWWWT